eukprot:6293989-Prymnesium_polylepis.1
MQHIHPILTCCRLRCCTLLPSTKKPWPFCGVPELRGLSAVRGWCSCAGNAGTRVTRAAGGAQRRAARARARRDAQTCLLKGSLYLQPDGSLYLQSDCEMTSSV